jgi:hypothetical protein
MSQSLRQCLVATLALVTALSGGVPAASAASVSVDATGTKTTDTTTATPMGTSGNFPTEMVAVGLAVAGIVFAAAGALAFRRQQRERDETGEDGPETRRNR